MLLKLTRQDGQSTILNSELFVSAIPYGDGSHIELDRRSQLDPCYYVVKETPNQIWRMISEAKAFCEGQT